MAIKAVHLIGAGGHGRVVADALIACGTSRDAIVPRDGRSGLELLGMPVVTPEVVEEMAGAWFHVAVGPAAIRERLHVAAIASGAMPLTVIHPASTVSPDATITAGALVAANAVVAPGAFVGEATIINHGAIVDHDVKIGDFCHIAPNVTLGGEVTIGDRVTIGSGAVVLPGVSIGDDAVIGAGAVVLAGIGAGETWVGNPARKLAK